MIRIGIITLCLAAWSSTVVCADEPKKEPAILLKPARVFDGSSVEAHEGWVVLVRGEKIEAAGPADKVKAPSDVKVIDLPKMTLLPGLIDAHTHVLLHPYNEAK